MTHDLKTVKIENDEQIWKSFTVSKIVLEYTHNKLLYKQTQGHELSIHRRILEIHTAK